MNVRYMFKISILVGLMVLVGVRSWSDTPTNRQKHLDDTLIKAVKAEDKRAIFAALKSGANPNARGFSRNKYSAGKSTPLLIYLDHDSEDDLTIVKALLKAGADPNLTDGAGMTSPLMIAIEWNHPKTVRFLLQHGSNPRYKDRLRGTALHMTAGALDTQSLSLLLNAGADINAQDDSGRTPLYRASEIGNLEPVQVLLKHHADPNLRDKEGKTALDAIEGKPLEGQAALDAINGKQVLSAWIAKNQTQIINLLRKAGAKTGQEIDAKRK